MNRSRARAYFRTVILIAVSALLLPMLWRSTAQAATAPLPPTGLTAVGGTTGTGGPQITLQWTASANATAYLIQRRETTTGPFSFVKVVTSTSYVDTTMSKNTWFYYVVAAVNADALSANSGQVLVASGTPALPPTARGVAIETPGNTVAPGAFNEREMWQRIRELDDSARTGGYTGPSLANDIL
ncbi:MAG: hypothetical protein LC749_09550, partial [Actinobacteria bacterium]|nr:hypothetical protein [Actinomycetota bacterium]